MLCLDVKTSASQLHSEGAGFIIEEGHLYRRLAVYYLLTHLGYRNHVIPVLDLRCRVREMAEGLHRSYGVMVSARKPKLSG